jgi:hypothetical protein
MGLITPAAKTFPRDREGQRVLFEEAARKFAYKLRFKPLKTIFTG